MPRNQSLTIQILDLSSNESGSIITTTTTTTTSTSRHREPLHNKFWAMKLFNRFRKLLVRLLFSTTPSYRDGGGGKPGRRRSDDGHHAAAADHDPPKISCSSSSMYNYSTQLHYSEAVADCIEFLNKSNSASSTPATTTTHDGDDDLYNGFDERRPNEIGHVWV
ncbi:hypothetical protein LINGRAHAP2_LOCUS10025 [Linum grandiflorum]